MFQHSAPEWEGEHHQNLLSLRDRISENYRRGSPNLKGHKGAYVLRSHGSVSHIY